MERRLLYYVIPKVSFEAEGRRFYAGEKYPVRERDDKYVILVADNGDFCFSNKLMEQALEEWDMEVEEVE